MAQADQDRFAPHSICFGCGPANKKGLQIKSHWETAAGGLPGTQSGAALTGAGGLPGTQSGGPPVPSAPGSPTASTTTAAPGTTTAEAETQGATAPLFAMDYTPLEHHQAFPGVVNGGILGALLDCHSNWCAATALMHKWGWDAPQCTVTADFHVKLRRPTPAGKPLRLQARVEAISEDRATIHCDVLCDGKVTATCDGLFVAVKEGHPAWHRWG